MTQERGPHAETLFSNLADLDHRAELGDTSGNTLSGGDPTVSQLRGELEEFLRDLRQPVPPDGFETEPACRTVTQMVQKLGDRPDQTAATLDAASETDREVRVEPLGNMGQYELLSKLGEGGMGAVYKARHAKLDKIVALKVLPRDRTKDKSAVARFEREMRAVGKLDHPNIVRAMDAGEVDGMHFLVMEYVEGSDLSHLVKQSGPLPIADACELIRQAAIGLDEAHDQGMVHRDIKPSNLMLCRAGKRKPPVVKILDLGLALLSEAHTPDVHGLTGTGQMMGTLDYMAPEQGGDSHVVDIRADIYSLGASLYKLLTGEAIYHGKQYQTPVQKLMALASQPAPAIQSRRAGISDALAAVVHRMLDKNPARRFATPQEVADALAPFCTAADLAALLATPGSSVATSSDASPSATEPHLSSSDVGTDPPQCTPHAPREESEQKLKVERRPQAGIVTRSVTTTLRKPPQWLVATLALAGLAALLAGVIFYWQTPQGTVRIEINDDSITAQVDSKGVDIKKGNDKPIRVEPGEHGLRILHGDLDFETPKFILKKGDVVTLKVEYFPGKIQVTKVGESQPFFLREIKPTDSDQLAQANRAFALAFNGKSSCIDITSLQLPSSGPLTFEAYITPNAGDDRSVGTLAMLEGPRRLSLQQVGRTLEARYEGREFVRVVTSPAVLKVGHRTHVAAVWDKDKSTFSLFVDGRRANTEVEGTRDEGPNGRTSILGAISHNEGVVKLPFDGLLDEMRISTIARYADDFVPPKRLEGGKYTLALYHFDDGIGDVLTDSSGNAHHGKIEGAKWVKADGTPPTELARNQLQFDGQSLVELRGLGHPGDGDYTLEAYVTLTGRDKLAEIIRFDRTRLAFFPSDKTQLMFFATCEQAGQGVNISVSGGQLEDHRRTHVAGVKTQHELRIYLDGKLIGREKWPGGKVPEAGKNPRLVIGGTLDGVLQEVRISKSARYDSDFAPPPRHTPDKDTVALYHCDEGTGDVLTDSSGHGHHGKIVGATWVPTESTTRDQDRRAAEYVLSLGGTIWIKANGNDREITSVGALPREAFDFTQVFLGNKLKVSDAGLAHFKDCKNLTHLMLDQPHVSDAGLAHFRDCKNLAFLDLRGTQVSDAGLAHFKDCKNLTSLYLNSPDVSDAGLAHFKDCKNLKVLTLYCPPVSDAGLAHFKDCKSLTTLSLASAQASDAGLAHFKDCKKLALLDLRGFQVSDAGLAHFKDCANLTTLHMDNSEVSDAGLAHFRDCKNLNYLNLRGTQVSDAGLAHFKDCKHLTGLDLRGTQVTDAGLAHLKRSKTIEILSVGNTGINDVGLEHLAGLKTLKSLWLKGAKVTDDGVKKLAAALQGCQIVWDGGTIEPTHFTNTLGMEFALVPKGKSWLGGGGSKLGDKEVEFKDDFYLGVYEVTQEEWERVMKTNPSMFARTGRKDLIGNLVDAELKRFPVEQVSWGDAQIFLKELNRLDAQAGWVYRLPKQSEWEYACRGGPMADPSEARFYYYLDKAADRLLPGQANFQYAGCPARTTKVGQYQPNRLGLYDMHGNVWEWCDDRAANSNDRQVGRGGSWDSGGEFACSANAFFSQPSAFKSGSFGLRVARVRITADPDRSAAEWARSAGARAVTIRVNRAERIVNRSEELPQDPFELLFLDFYESKTVPNDEFSCLAELRHLRGMGLGRSNVSDRGLELIAKSPTIQALDLWNTPVTDSGIAALKDMKSLTDVVLLDCQITDIGFGHLRQCRGLARVYADSVPISLEGVRSIGELTSLRWLSLRGVKAVPAGLKDWKDLSNLTFLDIVNTGITDASLVSLKDLKNIKELNVSENHITDEGLLHLESMSTLRVLSLAKTQVSAAAATKLAAALPLCKIQTDHGAFGPFSEPEKK